VSRRGSRLATTTITVVTRPVSTAGLGAARDHAPPSGRTSIGTEHKHRTTTSRQNQHMPNGISAKSTSTLMFHVPLTLRTVVT
jgi:hypothetical protein